MGAVENRESCECPRPGAFRRSPEIRTVPVFKGRLMSAAMAARAKATEASVQAKASSTPSGASERTTAAIAPASGCLSCTESPGAGRALVSRKAPLAEIDRKAAGAGAPAIRTHIRRRRQRDAIRLLLPILSTAAMLRTPVACRRTPNRRRQRLG